MESHVTGVFVFHCNGTLTLHKQQRIIVIVEFGGRLGGRVVVEFAGTTQTVFVFDRGFA